MNIMHYKLWYLGFSILLITPGILFLLIFGLRLGIDFTGGTLLEAQFSSEVSPGDISKLLERDYGEAGAVQTIDSKTVLLRLKPINQSQKSQLLDTLKGKFGDLKELRFETVGPTIGKELTRNAMLALSFASLAILIYIAWAFRKVPKPASSWRFALCTIAALLHDVLVLLGAMAILGHYFRVEVDSLFVTALLTVIGFSVHDTIVVFDRIRENLRRYAGHSFTEIVNASIVQTLGRSLSTSLTVLLVLLALFLFGGASIRWFVVALLIGITSGTYSSIFNAAPLLVLWEEWRNKSKMR